MPSVVTAGPSTWMPIPCESVSILKSAVRIANAISLGKLPVGQTAGPIIWPVSLTESCSAASALLG